MKSQGELIRVTHVDGRAKLEVPDHPIVRFIEGDGVGPEITRAMQTVVHGATHFAYRNLRSIVFEEVLMGKKAYAANGEYFSERSLHQLREGVVSIKGPLATPIGHGHSSANVWLRQKLNLFACVRPIVYFEGVPAPLRTPEKVDIMVFRENVEDIYAGIDLAPGSPEARALLQFLQSELPNQYRKIAFPNPDSLGLGVKPISRDGSSQLVRAAIEYAIKHRLPSVTLVQKGNIMKYTEGLFRDEGYRVAREEFGATLVDQGPSCEIRVMGHTVLVKDILADAFMQNVVLDPQDYSVVATTNLNGDYISDLIAALVGGIGIAPGANINYQTGVAVFEATHGTVERFVGQDKVNPTSLILSAEMMLRYLNFNEAADVLRKGLSRTLREQKMTYDLARQIPGVEALSMTSFASRIVQNMR